MSSSSAPSITGIDVEAAAGVGVKSGSAWLAARTNERGRRAMWLQLALRMLISVWNDNP